MTRHAATASPESGPIQALEPCPFCGGKATVGKWFSVDGSGRPDVYRASCVFGCGRSSDELTEANAATAWNRRAPTASPAERQQEPREAIKPDRTTMLEGALRQIASEWLSRAESCRHFYERHGGEFSEGKGAAYSICAGQLLYALSTEEPASVLEGGRGSSRSHPSGVAPPALTDPQAQHSTGEDQ
jgi:hypothetical protein